MIYQGIRIDGEMARRWIERTIGWKLIARMARPYRIVSIGFEDLALFGDWSDGAFAKMVSEDGAHIRFNPKVNLEKAAGFLNRRVRLRLKPSEVYIFAFLHELGHTHQAAGLLSQGAISGRRWLGAGDEEIRGLRRQAEDFADAWAKVEFRKWRRRARP